MPIHGGPNQKDQEEMKSRTIIKRIRKLKIPARAKAELLMLWTRARRLAEAVILFVSAHRRFGEALVMGAVVAFLLSQIPWVGGFLALCALVTAASVGLLRELREDVARFFEAAS